MLVSGSWFRQDDLERLGGVANVIHLFDLENDGNLDSILPKVDVLLTASWPKSLTPERMSMMKNLKLVQSLFAGVDSLPVSSLPHDVILCSNAGAYSKEVAEHAWALTLAASRCITEFSRMSKNQPFFMERMQEVAMRMINLEGRTAGVLGYGGIGRAYAAIASAFGMKIVAFGRKSTDQSEDVELHTGREGLYEVLRKSDVLLLALPLTKNTRGLLGEPELSVMKEQAILVNIARGDLVKRDAMLNHLRNHPRFWYATDVGWRLDGKETADPENQFGDLENYLVTPHVAGVSSQPTGRPSALAVDNVIRFIQNKPVRNVVDKSEY